MLPLFLTYEAICKVLLYLYFRITPKVYSCHSKKPLKCRPKNHTLSYPDIKHKNKYKMNDMVSRAKFLLEKTQKDHYKDKEFLKILNFDSVL